MVIDLVAIAILVVLFAIAAIRGEHIGVVTLPAACGVGIWLAGMPLEEVIDGFPVSILVLLAGVTYFFGIAHVNGTIDSIIQGALDKVGDRAILIPFLFFFLTMGISSMGSPLAGLVMAPIGMPVARHFKVDTMLMGLSIGCGLSAGGFAPTSLFGIVTYGTAQSANIELGAMQLFLFAIVVNFVLMVVAFFLFGGPGLIGSRAAGDTRGLADADESHAPPERAAQNPVSASLATSSTGEAVVARFEWPQKLTVAFMLLLILLVVVLASTGRDPDIGVLCFALAAMLAFIQPEEGRQALRRIDWSTVLLVGGIITYVGVLQAMGAVDTLGELAAQVGAPVVASLVICLIGALVSAFASTTGILAALVPLAIPLVASADIPGWAIICSLALCSSIVDVSPFSTVGATLAATAPDEERPRVTSLLMRWGLSLIVIGPVVLVLGVVLPVSL